MHSSSVVAHITRFGCLGLPVVDSRTRTVLRALPSSRWRGLRPGEGARAPVVTRSGVGEGWAAASPSPRCVVVRPSTGRRSRHRWRHQCNWPRCGRDCPGPRADRSPRRGHTHCRSNQAPRHSGQAQPHRSAGQHTPHRYIAGLPHRGSDQAVPRRRPPDHQCRPLVCRSAPGHRRYRNCHSW